MMLQMIMQEQDKAIDSITGTVATLTEQSGLMGQEISEHIECVQKTNTLIHSKSQLTHILRDRMLDDLEANVDTTDSKLQKNLKRLKKFVRETEGESAAGGPFVSIPYDCFVVSITDYTLHCVHLANNL